MESLIQHSTCNAFKKTVEKTALHSCFKPRGVAVVGATDRDGAVGKTVLENLLKSRSKADGSVPFQLYPINPTRKTCCGLECSTSVETCPKPVDLAVIVTPAKTVPSVMESCGKAGVAVAIVISAGFKELGPVGQKLENEVVKVAKDYKIRLIGPNCLGMMVPSSYLNATFAADEALPGTVAFVSQSGAMCTAVLDWALEEKLGFSAFVSIGSMADVEWGDLFEYFENDPHTKAVLVYMETIGNVSHFLTAAKALSEKKPILAIKAGQTSAAAVAAASHTGSLAGSHSAFLSAMKYSGVLVVETIQELCEYALVLGKQPQPAASGKIILITNAGGPGVLATDAAVLSGAELVPLTDSCISKLNTILPSAWSHANPVDVLGDATAALYASTLKIVLEEDAHVDSILTILSPQSVTEPKATAEQLSKAIKDWSAANPERAAKITFLCAWMGKSQVKEGFNILSENGIPTFSYPDAAASIFGKLAMYRKEREQSKLELLLSKPKTPSFEQFKPYCPSGAVEQAQKLFDLAKNEKRTILTEDESKTLLAAYGFPVAQTKIANSIEQAVNLAPTVGYPLVMKLHSSTITHKSDVGGVQLNLTTIEGVKKAYKLIYDNVSKAKGSEHFHGVTLQPMIDTKQGVELILGSSFDPQFGNLILFGSGGCAVEIYKDTALGIPPLNLVHSELLIRSTKVAHALSSETESDNQRFAKVSIQKLTEIVSQFSMMIHECAEEIAECDINPLLASAHSIVALDARIILKTDEQKKEPIIQAISPYPKQYEKTYINEKQHSIQIYPTHTSDFHKLKHFTTEYVAASKLGSFTTQNKQMAAESAKKDVFSNPLFKNFSLEKHIVPPMSMCDYARAIPLCAYIAQIDKIIGCTYVRKHPLVKTQAMLQVAALPYPAVQNQIAQKEYDDVIYKLIQHTMYVAAQEKITFLFSQVFQENESQIMKQAGFNIHYDENTLLYVCTYQSG